MFSLCLSWPLFTIPLSHSRFGSATKCHFLLQYLKETEASVVLVEFNKTKTDENVDYSRKPRDHDRLSFSACT